MRFKAIKIKIQNDKSVPFVTLSVSKKDKSVFLLLSKIEIKHI